MDALRENTGKKWAQLVSIAVFAFVFLLPMGFFIQQAFFSEMARADSLWDWNVLQVVMLTLGRTLMQAMASTFFTLILGAVLGLLLVFAEFPFKKSIRSAVETLGAFCFALPGVSVAMFVLLAAKIFPLIPAQGFFAIVAAHVFMNFLFVGTQFYYSTLQWLQKDGQSQIEAATTLGASQFQIFRDLVCRNLAPRVSEFLLPTFFYSMMAFNTVLILGGSPQQSTPEVLLFYFSAQDPTFTRLRLALPVFLVAFFVAQLLFERFSAKTQIRYRPSVRDDEELLFFRWRLRPLTFMAVAFLVPVFCFFVFPILELQKHFSLNGFRLEDEWIGSTLISLLLALYSGALGWVAFQILIRCRSSLHRFFSKWIVLSPMMLMLFWMSTPIFGLLSSWGATAQFFALGFLISCTQLPLIAKWIEDRKQAIDSEVFEAAAVLGTRPSMMPSQLLIPVMRDFEVKIFSFLALKSFGEIAIASFVAPELPLLAIVSRQFAARYNFFGISWILLVMGLLCVLLLAMQNGKWLVRNRVWFRG